MSMNVTICVDGQLSGLRIEMNRSQPGRRFPVLAAGDVRIIWPCYEEQAAHALTALAESCLQAADELRTMPAVQDAV